MRCEECNRDFESGESRDQHNRDKHNIGMKSHELKKMKKERALEEKKLERDSMAKRKRMKSFAMYGGIGIVLIVGLFFLTTLSSAQPDVTGLVLASDPVKGDENAPVTIVEFSDFECPFCTRFYQQTLPELKSEYIDTGKVKFVYKDFASSHSHPKAELAAQAAQCAADQGNFWEYHDLLFENNYQGDSYSRMHNTQAVNLFKQYATRLGLDADQFNSCLDGGEKLNTVRADRNDAQSVGVRGTPSFLVNGQLIVGAQSFATFSEIIESELARS